MGIENLMQNPNYFLQHPLDYHGEDIDYVSLTFGYGIGINIPCLNKIGAGGQVTITKDYFDRWYFSGGETGGISLVPGCVSIVAGRIIDDKYRVSLDATLLKFIPGRSSNITISLVFSIGESQSGDIKAMEIGIATPQFSISNNWCTKIESFLGQHLFN